MKKHGFFWMIILSATVFVFSFAVMPVMASDTLYVASASAAEEETEIEEEAAEEEYAEEEQAAEEEAAEEEALDEEAPAEEETDTETEEATD